MSPAGRKEGISGERSEQSCGNPNDRNGKRQNLKASCFNFNLVIPEPGFSEPQLESLSRNTHAKYFFF